MEFSAQLTFRESWVDGRLAYGLPNDGSKQQTAGARFIEKYSTPRLQSPIFLF